MSTTFENLMKKSKLKEALAKELDVEKKFLEVLLKLKQNKLSDNDSKKAFKELCLKIEETKQMPFVYLETSKRQVFLLNVRIDKMLTKLKKKEKSEHEELYNLLTDGSTIKGYATGTAKRSIDPNTNTPLQDQLRDKPVSVLAIRPSELSVSGKVKKANINLKMTQLAYTPRAKSGEAAVVKFGLEAADTTKFDASYKYLAALFTGDLKEFFEAAKGGILSPQDQIKYAAAFKGMGLKKAELKGHFSDCSSNYSEMSDLQKANYEDKNEEVEAWSTAMSALFARSKEEKAQANDEIRALSESLHEEITHLEEIKIAIEKEDWSSDVFKGALGNKVGRFFTSNDNKTREKAKRLLLAEYKETFVSLKTYSKLYAKASLANADMTNIHSPKDFASRLKAVHVAIGGIKAESSTSKDDKYQTFRTNVLDFAGLEDWTEEGLTEKVLELSSEIERNIKLEVKAGSVADESKIKLLKFTKAIAKEIQDYNTKLVPLQKAWKMMDDGVTPWYDRFEALKKQKKNSGLDDAETKELGEIAQRLETIVTRMEGLQGKAELYKASIDKKQKAVVKALKDLELA